MHLILTLPFLGTALGAAMVFLLRGKMSDLLRKLLLGFASGVMVAASVWSLLIMVNDTTDVYESEKLQFPFSEMTKEAESAWATEYSVDVKVQLKKK